MVTSINKEKWLKLCKIIGVSVSTANAVYETHIRMKDAIDSDLDLPLSQLKHKDLSYSCYENEILFFDKQLMDESCGMLRYFNNSTRETKNPCIKKTTTKKPEYLTLI